MSLLGELFGYGAGDYDLIGVPRRSEDACLVCGLSVYAHSQEQSAICLNRLYATQPSPEGQRGQTTSERAD